MIDLNTLEARIAHAKSEELTMGMEPAEMESLCVLIRRQEAELAEARAAEGRGYLSGLMEQAASRRAAPWTDFDDKPIYEGDTIRHPDGEQGKVMVLSMEREPTDRWRVDYGTGSLARLCLQIGEKGRAVVLLAGPLAPALPTPQDEDIGQVDLLALRRLTSHFNSFIADCMDLTGNPVAPSMRALAQARACMPRGQSTAYTTPSKEG